VLESEARYHHILDSMMEGCQIIGFDWTYVYVNDVVAKQGQHTRAELLNHTMMEVYPGIENTELFATLMQCMEERTPKRLENRFVFPDGSMGWFELSIQPAREGIFILSSDITERKQAEERFRLVVESAPNAMLLVNREGIIEMVNSQTENYFGYDRTELIGMNVDSLVPEDLRGNHMHHRQGFLVDPQTRPMGVGRDLHGLRKDGSEFPVEIGLTPIQTQDGLLVIATIVDITERKRADEALEAKNDELKKMSQQLWQAAKLATMGELAASIAHELNNPLATISLRTEMLQSQFTPDDAPFRSLKVIESEVSRMSNLVGNLLQFSRRSSTQVSTIHLNEEVVNTLELIQYHLRKNSILTVQELSPDLSLVHADRQQLRQVFLNLFTNAADAMPLGGMLTIRTWSGEKPDAGITAPLRRSATKSLGLPAPDVPQVFIEVSDTGEGIPPDKLERVWEAFYTTKPEGKGTGLGLAICRRIMQEHGGTIEVTSNGIPGKGTTVRLSLPAVKEG